MRRTVLLFALVLVSVLVAGCRKDRQGSANLSVITTLPEGIEATLVSVDRPGTYVDRARTDLGGTFHFTGVIPGKYMLVYQFLAPDIAPSRTPYNYGQSQVLEVKPGRNIVEWSVDTCAIVRRDE